jgi:hypothetical protein
MIAEYLFVRGTEAVAACFSAIAACDRLPPFGPPHKSRIGVVLAKSIDCLRERFIRHPDGKSARPFIRVPRQLPLFLAAMN